MTSSTERNETAAIAADDKGMQLSITEEPHGGKFALQINQKEDEILPLKESEWFWTSYSMNNYESYTSTKSNGTYKPELDVLYQKTNIVNVWVKPLYKAEELIFYTYAAVLIDGQEEEVLVPIKSDKNGDGIYKLGEDFVQGKWQQLQVDLLKTDPASVDGWASGLYVKANIDSEWIFDDLTCDYLETHDQAIDLGVLSGENITYADGMLQFINNDNVYDTTERIVIPKLDLNEKIRGIHAASEVIRLEPEHAAPVRTPIIDVPFSSDAWSVEDANYDTLTQGVSKKAPSIKAREDVPEIEGTSTSMIVPIRPEESRIRIRYSISTGHKLKFSDGSTTESVLPTITNGYSKWYDSDITISNDTSFNRDSFEILEIEYQVVGEERDIHIKSNGIATLNTPPFSTDGRTTLQFQLAKVDISNFGLPTPRTFMISVYGADGQKQYEAYAGYELVDNKGIITAILPKLNNVNKIEIKNIADDTDYDELRLYNFSLTATVDTDWDYKARYSQFRMPVTYLNTVSETDTASEVQRVRDYYSEEEYYGIKHLYAFGIVSSEGAQAQIEVSSNDILRFINPNKEPQAVTVGTKEYWLSYGESDIKLETVVSGAQLTLPPAEKRVMVLQKMSKGNEIENKNNIPYYQIDGLNTKPIMSEDLEVLYYLNKYDQSKLYAYDVNTGKSTKCTDAVFDSLVDVKGKRYVLADRGSDRLLYDLQEGTETLCSGELTVPDYSLSKDYTSLKKASHLTGQGDVFHVFDYDRVTYLYQIQNGEFLKIYESNRYTSSGSFYDPELVFDASGNNMALYYNFTDKMPTIILFKKTDGVWTQTKTITLSDESSSFKFSNDANKLYFNRESKIYELDLKTDAEKELQEGSISMVCGDGRLLYIDADETYYYLYNPVNGERQRITQYSIVSGTDVWYSPDYNQIVYIAPNNMLARYILGSDKPLERYLLSFDGCASWYAFRGGRWLLASQSLKPSTEELSLNGMTAEELNAIKPVDFEKLYQNDTEVVTVHVAIYMTSNSNKVSPAISNITVQTVANQVEERLAAASYQGYNKADYRKINAIFPIENFRKPAECYYILALGNDWLYTYKEGKLVRLPLGADEIAEDVTQNWIEIKQYGMTAGELRNIPDDALNDLLLNENYANTEFGIIYVVRPDDISTEPYKVEFRIQADAQYFNYENMVMEITVNGIGMTFTTPDDLSKDAIDQFMSWLSGRQNGKGDIFYHLQTSGGQYFINYFMISNVNVYNKATYNPIVPSVFSEIADEQEEDTELEVSDPEVSDSADPSELE